MKIRAFKKLLSYSLIAIKNLGVSKNGLNLAGGDTR